MSNGTGSSGNVIAALCSFFIPGLGQLLQGKLLLAAFMFITVGVGYFFWVLIIPAIGAAIIHLWSIIDAATFKSD
jgi:TM2 domain-containing membrane protein YozV